MPKGSTKKKTRSENAEWYTPPWLFEELGVQFDLDPCSPGADVVPWVPATKSYTAEDDGLAQLWEGRVWCNPPYGSQVPHWLRRLADHGDGIALVNARTDPRWFHDYVPRADAICFLKGRLKFIDGRTGTVQAGQIAGSMLIAYGQECATLLKEAEMGFCLPIPHQ